MSRKSLSAVDTAWLRMEDPTNLMMISGIMVFGVTDVSLTLPGFKVQYS